jgi:hypothetical protein
MEYALVIAAQPIYFAILSVMVIYFICEDIRYGKIRRN